MMMHQSRFLTRAALLCLLVVSGEAIAQDYVAPPVEVSTEKVRIGNKTYLSHVVKEKQTLYSIAKAYDVKVDALYDANPSLRNSGLQTGTILYIPYVEGQQTAPDGSRYIEHRVRWFEDLDDIARRYGVDEDRIIEANNLPSRKVKSRQILRIPIGPDMPDDPFADGWDFPEDTTFVTPADTTEQSWEPEPPRIVYESRADVSMALVFPFLSGETPNEANMDFYAGVLLAVRDLRARGITTRLDVYDLSAGIPSREELEKCDFVLGPVAPRDLESVLDRVGSAVPVISPMDQKAYSLAEFNENFIQAPTATEFQYQDLARWILSEHKPGDRVILVRMKNASDNQALSTVEALLQEAGISCLDLTYSLPEGRGIPPRLAEMMNKEGVNRVVVASDNGPFTGDLVRNLGIMLGRGYKPLLYAPAKIRTFDAVEGNGLYDAHLHLSCSYYVDYASEPVKKFVRTFRAYYRTEPSQFAFQGYDTAMYFLTMSAKYGPWWPTALDREPGKGLHTDFRFTRTGEGFRSSWTNTAIRRVLYRDDFTTALTEE